MSTVTGILSELASVMRGRFSYGTFEVGGKHGGYRPARGDWVGAGRVAVPSLPAQSAGLVRPETDGRKGRRYHRFDALSENIHLVDGRC